MVIVDLFDQQKFLIKHVPASQQNPHSECVTNISAKADICRDAYLVTKTIILMYYLWKPHCNSG